MPVYTVQEVDGLSKTTQRPLSDNEAKAYFAPQVALSANKTTFTADGVDFAIITAQLKSVPLSDDNRVNLALSHKVILLVGEIVVELTTDNNGVATHEIAANDAGTYTISVQNLSSNTLTLQAV